MPKDQIEEDFRRLIGLLAIKEDMLPLMLELALQAEADGPSPVDGDFETQKQAAVAKARRRIDAARDLFSDGDISREEYLKRKTSLEREIAYWESRTTETQKAAVELRMCMEVLNLMTSLWDESTDEDRQQLARMLFEEIYYDLDKQQIVGFRLKPWAERFLSIRNAQFRAERDGLDSCDDSGGSPGGKGGGGAGGGEASAGSVEEKQNRPGLKTTSDLCPIGASGAQIAPTLETGQISVPDELDTLYPEPEQPEKLLTIAERDAIIRERYAAGVSQAELAWQFGISYQRVHQILRGE